jgi:hypothetical protein
VSDEQRRSLALLLAVSARALAFVFVVTVAIRLLPVQALNPAWQMTVCSVLLHQAFLPLLALALMHAASAVIPADGRLASARRRWRGLAVAAALGFLLLLPLQGFAIWRGLSQGIQQDATRRADAEKRSGAMLRPSRPPQVSTISRPACSACRVPPSLLQIGPCPWPSCASSWRPTCWRPGVS